MLLFGARLLSTVTFGWIITLQVGPLLLERVRYAVVLPSGKWVAIVAILVLQAYLVLAPNGRRRDRHRAAGPAPGGAARPAAGPGDAGGSSGAVCRPVGWSRRTSAPILPL
jgi:hypothetical protein